MSVILSDYTIFSDKDRLLAATGELEESIINAAASDKMHDVVAYVRDWQMDGEQKIEQVMDDFGEVFNQLPGKEKVENAIAKMKRKE